MAASGGNIEWSTTVKPILTALYGPFFDKNDAVEIIQAIIKRLVARSFKLNTYYLQFEMSLLDRCLGIIYILTFLLLLLYIFASTLLFVFPI
jgi:hypothetical protein